MVYRSDQDIYQKVTEALRAELLEEGELTDDWDSASVDDP